MKRYGFSVSILLLLGGCSGSGDPAENATGPERRAGTALTVAAMEISSGAGAPGTPAARMLSGRFEIRAPHPGEESVMDATVGGACLIAQVPTTPKSCTAAAQCNIAASPGKPAMFGYCESGTCWVKANGQPGAKYCVKGLGEGRHEVPAFHPAEVYAHVDSSGPGRGTPVKWKVLGCLNGPLTPGAPAPCAGGPGVSMHDEGNARIVP